MRTRSSLEKHKGCFGKDEMEKRIRNYVKWMNEVLANDQTMGWTKEEWDKMAREHIIQISFFQHERLIHLLVTITFAILTIATVLFDVFYFSIGVVILTILLLILLIPYIRHYYILENSVQQMYDQYDKILEHTGIENTFRID